VPERPPPRDEDERPSKSQRKRDAHALQDLAESLLELADSELERVPMPERLRDAVLEGRRIKAHGALARQKQYLGRLMRDIDPAPIRDALDEVHARGHAHTAHFHRIERWRDRLIAEGDPALEALLEEAPQADRQHLRSLVREVTKERALNHPPRAARVLFRYLRELFGPSA
jgi:ribosome-associated protein